MRIHNITYPDINNGLGNRVSLWVSGCKHNCKGCHNPETWPFDSGHEFTDKDKEELFKILSLPYINGITLTGGDPLYSHEDVEKLLIEIKEKFPDKDVWLFTGFVLEVIIGTELASVLKYVDVLVDGPYVEHLRDVSLPFRGSSNQRILKKNDNGEFVEFNIE